MRMPEQGQRIKVTSDIFNKSPFHPSPKDGKQVFGSKKYNDFGNTFVNPLFNYATGGFLDLPSDVNKVGSHHMVPVDEMAEWRDRCVGKVTKTATVEMHFSGKDIMLTTREPKLSFAGALGNIGTYRPNC